MGKERIQAMIALQMLVGLVFIFMGVTKLADKFVHAVPDSVKGGILLAAPVTVMAGQLGFWLFFLFCVEYYYFHQFFLPSGTISGNKSPDDRYTYFIIFKESFVNSFIIIMVRTLRKPILQYNLYS